MRSLSETQFTLNCDSCKHLRIISHGLWLEYEYDVVSDFSANGSLKTSKNSLLKKKSMRKLAKIATNILRTLEINSNLQQ